MARSFERRASRDPQRDRVPLVFRTSVVQGPPPPPGFVREPFVWEDLMRAEPPPKLAEGERRLALPGREDADAETVVHEVVLVKVVCETGAPVIDVEHVLYVDRRTLAGAIAVEERTVGVAVDKALAAGEQVFDSHERTLEGPLRHVVKAERRIWNGLLGGVRSVTTGVVTFPDRFRRRWAAAASFLGSEANRKRFWRGLAHPHELNREEKAITLFVAVTSVVAVLLLSHIAFTLTFPDLARDWRAVFLLFAFGLVTGLAVPFPIEPALFAGAAVLGAVGAIAVTVSAKVTAAWLVFFVGDSVNGALERRAAARPRFARFLRASERFAERFGVLAVALFLTVPGLPDAIALYVFGSLGMRLHWFLLGVAIGGATLYSAVLFGVYALLGLH